MAIQHHFVVVVEDGNVYLDNDTLNSMFWDGSVYDTDTEQWQPNYEQEADNTKAYELLRNALANVEWADLKEMNA